MSNHQTILKLAPDFHIACHNCEQRMTLDGLEPFEEMACPNCNAKIVIPFPFHNHLLEEIIGTGSTATVYRALDYSLDRDVAVKILDQEISHDNDKVEIFLAASRKASAINHQNIVSVFSCGNADHTPYVITEFMRGGSLANYLKQHGKFSDIRQAIEIIKQVATGIQQVHNADLIYSDLSPNDIFLDLDMNAKLSDIGFVNLRWDKNGDFEQYISPERASHGEVSELSDIYGIGAIMYHMFTGQAPFVGDNADEMLKLRLAGTVAAPNELNPKINKELSDLIVQMLSPYPSERPHSANELINKLESIKVKKMSGKSFNVKTPPKSTIKREVKSKSGNSVIKIFAVFTVVLIMALSADFMRGEKSLLFAKGKPLHKIAIRIKGEKALEKSAKTMVFSMKEEVEVQKEVISLEEKEVTNSEDTVVETTKTVIAPKKKRKVRTMERPRPKGIDFPKRKTDLQKYVKSFPTEAAQKIEKERISIIALARPELSKLMSSNPYQPEGKIIVLRKLGGNKLLEERCISVKANSYEIVLKKPKGKTMHLKWSEVPLKQLVTFYEYYINQRLEFLEVAPTEDHKAQIRESAVLSVVRVALLTDWYGDTDTSKKYTKWVVKLSPKHKSAMKKMLPYQFR